MSEKRWVDRLTSDDLGFLKRFLLASGSLKKLAEQYGISYPTVRLRLDRLIMKVEILDNNEDISEFERQLRASFADGKVDQPTFELLLNTYRQDVESCRENRENDKTNVS
jgi:hypothetical protein